MSERSRLLTFALVTTLTSACGPKWRASLTPSSPAVSGPSVGLIAEGAALQRRGVRDEVVRSLERATQRWVVPVEAGGSSDEADLKSLHARLAKEERSIAGYDRREPQCTTESVALAAIHRNAEAVYHVALELTERVRPASEAEAQSSGREPALAGVLGVLGLVRRDTVIEENLSGSVTLVLFGQKRSPRPVRIARRMVHVEPAAWTSRMDVGAAVSEALRELPAIQRPEWDGFARRLVSAGCPLLAVAVYESALKPATLPRDFRKAALAAMTRSLGRRGAKQMTEQVSTKFRTALQAGDLDAAATILAEYQASPARQPETAKKLAEALDAARRKTLARADGAEQGAPPAVTETPAPTEPPAPPSYSCPTLCELHMVELCNRDTVLWNSHRKKWEPTPCGTKRDEPFLKDCYEQQWLTGAFHNSCVVPCESTSEGRERLLHLLQGAGCLSDRS